MPDISFIIVNWNTKELLLECIASIYQTVKEIAFEIWVVDNGSSDGSVEAVKEKYPRIKIIENRTNLGFAAANNLALKRMGGHYALMLNTDTVLTEGAVSELHNFMQGNPEAAIACGQLLNQEVPNRTRLPIFPPSSP